MQASLQSKPLRVKD